MPLLSYARAEIQDFAGKKNKDPQMVFNNFGGVV